MASRKDEPDGIRNNQSLYGPPRGKGSPTKELEQIVVEVMDNLNEELGGKPYPEPDNEDHKA